LSESQIITADAKDTAGFLILTCSYVEETFHYILSRWICGNI